MPQMMPMIWIFILLSMIFILMLLISFTYFMFLPMLYPKKSLYSTPPSWSWKW